MKLFAVIGKSVLPNKMPWMWNHACKCLGIPAHYFRINPINVKNAVKVIHELQLSGCNVIPPFTRDMVKYLDELDKSVEFLQAVNTIRNDNGKLIGLNTDFYAIVNSLQEGGVELTGKRVVVLGTGGAARAAVYGLLKAGVQDVVIIDRTYERAITVAKQIGGRAVHFGGVKREIQHADIVISCIPPNRRIVKKEWLRTELVVFDTNYTSDSLLLQDAKETGCQIISGAHWLVHQSASAFEYFLNENPLVCMQEAMEATLTTHIGHNSISLIGFMGVGKTTVGKHLAELTGYEFVDTDKLIEQKAGASIPDIFEQSGEAKFREIERAVFRELDFSSPKIISCGGGSVMDENTQNLLTDHSTVIWLWNELKISIHRIRKGTRPLFNVRDVEKKAKALFAERVPIYAQSADIMIVNEHLGTRRVAKKIYEEVSRLSRNNL